MDSVAVLCDHLRVAKKPEDIFGALVDGSSAERKAALKHVFNGFVQMVHPDKNPGLADAGQYVTKLMAFRKEAEKLIDDELYGKPRKATVNATLHSRAGAYEVTEEFRTGEIADLFLGTHKKMTCVIKVVRRSSDNDLLDFEARTLTELHRFSDEKAKVFQKYLPKLIDSFPMIEGGKHRKVNVLDLAGPTAEYVKILKDKKGLTADPNYYSLAEIQAAYPSGLDARDAAWMIRRVFEGIGWVHSVGYVHGALLPEHILVHPTEHGARIVGWSYAVKNGQRLTAISGLRQRMYPAYVWKKQPATPMLDIQLLGATALMMLDNSAPTEIKAFFKQCVDGKVLDGWTAYKQFDVVLSKLYGRRAYRAFAMPPK